MKKPPDPKELAEEILKRSICTVQVGAVLADGSGIFSWGWNHAGPEGMGMHAEAHCLRRANKARLNGATLYVASRRHRNHKVITSQPCLECQALLKGLTRVLWRDADGRWKDL